MMRLASILIVSLLMATAACGKSEPIANAPAPQPSAAPAAAAPAPTQNAPQASVAPAQPAVEANDEAVEHIAETDEGAEMKDDPASKGTPPLKLAQLPPRAPASAKFKEGVHYMRLSPAQPVEVSPDQVQIVEFFWYGCPRCNALDPRVEAWRKSGKPDYVVFNRIPAVSSDRWRFHARFFYAAEALGRLEELHPLIFKEIHERGNPLDSIDAARAFFTAHGVDAQAFQKAFGSMTLERKLDQSYVLAQRYRITGVPTFVINGKFVADVTSAGGEEQLFALLNEVAAREHAKD